LEERLVHSYGDFVQDGQGEEALANGRLVGNHDHRQTKACELGECVADPRHEYELLPREDIVFRSTAVYHAVAVNKDGGTSRVAANLRENMSKHYSGLIGTSVQPHTRAN
jgi:hypothetical protein